MSQYLLSTFAGDGDAQGDPQSPSDMQSFMGRVIALEDEMDADGAFVFGGALHTPDAATVVRVAKAELIVTDGPFVESKEHVGGFYVINAADLDEALAWARKVVEAIGHPIEVRPFRATGHLKDQLPIGA